MGSKVSVKTVYDKRNPIQTWESGSYIEIPSFEALNKAIKLSKADFNAIMKLYSSLGPFIINIDSEAKLKVLVGASRAKVAWFYIGTIDPKTNMKHGYGMHITEKGTLYEGQFVNDKKSGIGRCFWTSGSYFVGKYKNGVAEGDGKLVYKDGSIYEGPLENNKLCGTGKLLYFNGDIYEGQFANDLREGQGKQQFTNGASYEGEWKENKMHGQGTIYYKSGDKVSGRWENDRYTR